MTRAQTMLARWMPAAAITVVMAATGNTAMATPVVTLTAPASNAKFSPAATVTLAATVTESDATATITKVEFFHGGTNLIGTVTAAPYTFNWTNVPTGAYAITAKATNSKSVVRASGARNIVVNTAPTISLTSPTAGATFYGLATVNLAVNATDTDGAIAKVQYFKGGTLIGTVTDAPFSYVWTGVAPGNYSLTAKATDNLGALVSSAAVAIVVKNPVEVAITGPVTNSKFSSPGNINFTVDAITRTCDTCSAPVAKVDFYQGTGTSTTLIGTSTTAPFTFNWTNVVAGKYTIKAIATDAQGLSTTSKTIAVTVNTPPTIAISSPTAGTSVAGLATFNITADVVDPDNNVSKVQFYRSGVLLATVTSPPYAFNWANVAPGTYNLTARATDSLGAVVTSAAVPVTVTNPITVAITNPVNKGRYLPPASVDLSADATDSNGTITQVAYYNGTALIGASSVAPYNVVWNNVDYGNYNLTAIATDNQGITKTSAIIKITVDTSPVVTVVAPTAGMTYASPATINLEATATNPGASITKVQFYGKGKLLATVTSPPYVYQWTGVLKGSYPITAKATDSLGVATTSAKVNIAVVDGSAPAVSVTAPADNALYLTSPANLSLSAAASTLSGTVTKVDFYNGDTLIGTVNSGTNGVYNLPWSGVAPGTYTLTTKATNSLNLVTVSEPITVVVDAAPALTLTSPANNTVYQAGDNIAISVDASDSDGSIAKVDFYQGTTLLATVTSGNNGTSGVYTTNWLNVAPGTYSLTATATDNDGASTTTPPITVTVNAPPTASWTAPTDGQTTTAPAIVTLTVNATDSDGTIAKVEFFNGTTLIGTVLKGQSGNSGNNYSFNWTSIPGGVYTLNAVATDSNGATDDAGSVSLIVNTAPTVSLTSPVNNSTANAGSSVTVTATAGDSDGNISQVDFYSGSTLIGSVTTGQSGNTGNTYTFNWPNVVSGSYSLTAMATDNQGASTTSQVIAINVNALPTVNLTSPANNSTINAGTAITLNATAADSDGTIAKVEFFSGTTLIGTVLAGSAGDTATGYTFSWSNAPAGTVQLTAVATDNQGSSTISASTTLTVNALPTIAITSPTNNATVAAGSPITLNASATDADGTIAKVEFFNGATLIGTVLTGSAGNAGSGYTMSWANAPTGTVQLTARATDNKGSSTTSATTTLNVNVLPTISLTSPANNAKVTVGTAIAFNATAADTDGTIAKVEFFNGNTLLGTVLSGGNGNTGTAYTFSWTNAPLGTFQLTARATDNAGGTVTTANTTVTVAEVEQVMYFIHADHLGTPRAITRPSDNAIVWKWENSDPFGANAPNEDPANTGTAFKYNLRFPGQYYDQETQTHYNWNRDYDPATGRYMQSDPLGLYADINTFTYVGQSPLRFIDPTGLILCDDWGWMTINWFAGLAPRKKVYGPNTPQTSEVRRLPPIAGAKDLYRQKNAAELSSPCCDPSKLVPVTDYAVKFGPLRLLISLAMQSCAWNFIGSFDINIYPAGCKHIDVAVSNNSSFTSFSYGLGPSWQRGPMSDFRQIYTWNEGL